MKYECPRCGYSTCKKNDMRRHYKRKNICECIFGDYSQEDCLEMFKKGVKNKTSSGIFKKKIEDTTLIQEQIYNLQNNMNTTIEKLKNIESELKEKDKQITFLTCKLINENNGENFIYILQEREFVFLNEEVYKIGKTTKLKNRMNKYPKGSLIKGVYACTDIDNTEKEIINEFKNIFKMREDIGKEYFEGNLLKMSDIISDIIKTNNNLT